LSTMDPARRAQITEAMYLAMEKVSTVKHELYCGEVWAMAGGSPRHNALGAACITELKVALRGSDCAPLTSDQRVHVPATGNYCYPDVAVICGEPAYHAADPDSITNPRVIVEVLSKSTAKHDTGAKFEEYKSIASFREYVLVAQDRVHVEVRRREGEHRWVIDEYGAGSTIELRSIGITIDVDALYDGAFRFKGDEP
jgi:Uma2 family endonuclease